ncbi:MAG: B12-binding domain-containing radical SAM protein, partial [Armatimonadetes bacterium]|nr:B12-binding domain-containing radical SAM protein [Armatimonadota bacterium]
MRRNLLTEEKLLTPARRTATPRRGVLLFPNSYAVGMASLATHALYAALNARDAMAWERAFAGTAEGSTGPRALCSLESGAPLRDFDVIAVTSSYELDWPAIPAALAAGSVAPLRRERRESGPAPLVIAGGPAITTAPLPLAEIYDAAYIGEIEPALPALCEALALANPQETLERLAAIPGFFVPELHGEPRPGMLPRQCARDLDNFETASAILTPRSEFPNRFLVEIGRGCGRGCSFCLARQIYRPLRWRSLPRIMDTVRRGLRHTNDLGLIAAAVSDYPDLPGLCAALATLPPEVNLSTSSIRLESASAELLALLAGHGQRTVTYAPEAATERLRGAIGKTLGEDAL